MMSEECPRQFEYLEHTADVQLHAWGESLEEAMAQTVMAMYGYMTELDGVEKVFSMDMSAEGDDVQSLLARLLDEALYNFGTEPFFIARSFCLLELDRDNWRVKARGWGESFDKGRHVQGTEVKAITYSNMQIIEKAGRVDIFVIIDI